jgi:hypothetical protein
LLLSLNSYQMHRKKDPQEDRDVEIIDVSWIECLGKIGRVVYTCRIRIW